MQDIAKIGKAQEEEQAREDRFKGLFLYDTGGQFSSIQTNKNYSSKSNSNFMNDIIGVKVAFWQNHKIEQSTGNEEKMIGKMS